MLTIQQIFDIIDDNCDSTSTSYTTAKKVRDVNLAVDKFLGLAIQADGKWQVDDSAHTKDPILTTNLVASQRDYHFTVDEQSNYILDIFRVMVADENGRFYDLETADQQSKGYKSLGFVDGQNLTGKPTKYDKTGNGIFLDVIPSYSYTNGLKLFINREAYQFKTTDTALVPGFCPLFHEYFAIRPSYQFAYRKGLKNTADLRLEMLLMEDQITEYYSKRSKDEPTQIIPKWRSSR